MRFVMPALLALSLGAVSGNAADPSGPVTCMERATKDPRPTCKVVYGKLDALLAAKDWNGLGQALAPTSDFDTFTATLDWLQERVISGRGGFFVATFYARNLWLIGNSDKVEDPAKDLRMTAAMMTLYAFILIRVDGLESQDPSSPSHRLDQLIEQRGEVFRFLASKPKDVRDHVISNAVSMDRMLAPHREHNDDTLCNAGMTAMMSGLMSGQQREAPTPPGHIGKTIEVLPSPAWKPAFVAPEIYEPAKAKARAELQQTVEAFVDAMATADPRAQ
jgi:hypothetical protein